MMSVTDTLSRAERKRAELRRDIIDASFSCFAEQGYHGTGIADIATRLGIGHGTFYRYFENKRDIIDHVLDDLVARIVGSLVTDNAPDAADSLDEYRRQVERISDALTAILLDDPRIPRLLLFEATGIDADLTQRLFGLLDTAAELTGGYLKHGVDRGYLRENLDIEGTAQAINGMILAAVVRSLRGHDKEDVDSVAAAIRSLMFDGIKSPE
ncbi:TetR/AcrR family transcriptional regulator [Rhodococcus sp. NPDC058521]|uniref:TetR/AcrR family transcriptional regulator n=1 Tax=Rhodococcus sp. NPDC058521 TaxID=3346536 RepID=UPI00364F2AFC